MNCRSVIADENENGPYRRAFAYVLPYKSTEENIPFTEIQNAWNGEAGALAICADDEADLSVLFGGTKDSGVYAAENYESLFDAINEKGIGGLIPFEAIEPRYKVLQVDGLSILSNKFDPETWPLTARVSGEGSAVIDWQMIPLMNRDADKLTTLVLTGVTAMVRSTAQYMDLDPLYPAELIREPLIQADILHVNNEVPFARVCNQTKEELDTLHFCSKPAYMALLQDIGTDVLELDGDHFQDFGDDAVLYTLDMYDEAGLPYYGGGHNKAEAQEPLIISHNGNTFGFIGCNGKEIGYAAASDTRPGAVHCDMDLITKQVSELKAQGIIPIVTFQHVEVYKDKPIDAMRVDFEAVHDAGAVIVSGSQSHIPMEFDVYRDSMIHFGLGNLFFDQAFFLPETAVATIDRHVFYNGQYINTEFLTIRFTNCALSHYTEGDDRNALLERMFACSLVEDVDE